MRDPNASLPRAMRKHRRISNAEFIDRQACMASTGVRRSLHDFWRALGRTLNPICIFRHHPVGTTITVGVVVAAGTAGVVSPRARAQTRAFVSEAADAVRQALIRTLLARVFHWLVAPRNCPEPRTSSSAE